MDLAVVIIERRRRHLVRRREGRIADGEDVKVSQRPRQRQARSAVAGIGVELELSVIDERAGRRHRGLVFEIELRLGSNDPSRS